MLTVVDTNAASIDRSLEIADVPWPGEVSTAHDSEKGNAFWPWGPGGQEPPTLPRFHFFQEEYSPLPFSL